MSSSPAEIDYDLETPVEGKPQPAPLFKLPDDYARHFELAREERPRQRYALGELIINCLLRQGAM